MSTTDITKLYSPSEERMNILSHGIGFLLSIAALVLLVVRASVYGNAWHIVSFSIFGASLIVLYAASTLYHSVQKVKWRKRLQLLDHSFIYVLIAGTYTPFTLVTLRGTVGWVIFGVTWGLALLGIIFKFLSKGKYDVISTILYVLMGWVIVFAIQPLIHNLHQVGLIWLVSGGVAYTIGALFYIIGKIRYNHAIFHVFVLAGSFCHFITVFFYVLPK